MVYQVSRLTTIHLMTMTPYDGVFTQVLFLTNILPSPIGSHHFLRPAIFISVSSVVSVHTLNLRKPVPLLPLLPTPNLTTVTVCT